jgi:23S rRNA pseudouridine2605 synthase
MKKQFGRKPSGDKPAWKKSGAGSGKPDYNKKSSSGKPAFHKKKYASDKKSEGGDERSFGDKPFRKKTFGDKPFVKKSFGDKPDRGERKFGDKPFAKKSFGDKPDYEKRSSSDRPDRGERKFGDKPFAKKSFGDKPDRGERKFGDKPFAKKSFGDKPYGDREDRRKKEFGDKPFAKKSFGDKPYGDREDRRKKEFGEKKPFGDKPFVSKEGSYGRPFKKKTFADRKQFGKTNSSSSNKSEKINNDEWQVFENAEDAKAYIKSNREEKKSPGKLSPVAKEYSNDNRPLRAAAYSDNESYVRLNRFIANTGICSRREADDLIEAGVVKVNGKIVTELGTKIGPGDSVHYGDQLLRREKMSYVLLNKPKDYITTTDDPQERKTVMTLIEEAGKERIYPVGRLDRNTTGLLLFTNDGDLAQRLTHPKNNVRKIYHVSLDKNLKSDDFDKILKGYEMEDGFMKADELSFVGDGLDKKEVGIVIHSGRNRVVRRLFEGVGYDVVKLDRVSYAGLTKKNLPRGRFRHLTTEEVGILRMQIGGEKKQNFKKSDPKHNKGKRPKK